MDLKTRAIRFRNNFLIYSFLTGALVVLIDLGGIHSYKLSLWATSLLIVIQFVFIYQLYIHKKKFTKKERRAIWRAYADAILGAFVGCSIFFVWEMVTLVTKGLETMGGLFNDVFAAMYVVGLGLALFAGVFGAELIVNFTYYKHHVGNLTRRWSILLGLGIGVLAGIGLVVTAALLIPRQSPTLFLIRATLVIFISAIVSGFVSSSIYNRILQLDKAT